MAKRTGNSVAKKNDAVKPEVKSVKAIAAEIKQDFKDSAADTEKEAAQATKVAEQSVAEKAVVAETKKDETAKVVTAEKEDTKAAAEKKAEETAAEAKKRGRKAKTETTTKKTAVKKTTAKKTTTAKAAKTAKAEPEMEVFIEGFGGQINEKALIAKVLKDCKSKKVNLADIQLYIKPEDNACYYVANNDEVHGQVTLFD